VTHAEAVEKKLKEHAEQIRWCCLKSIGINVPLGKATEFIKSATKQITNNQIGSK